MEQRAGIRTAGNADRNAATRRKHTVFFNRFFDFLKPKKKSVPSDTVPVSTLLRREEAVE